MKPKGQWKSWPPPAGRYILGFTVRNPALLRRALPSALVLAALALTPLEARPEQIAVLMSAKVDVYEDALRGIGPDASPDA